jgi:hypothetical protein
MPILCKITDDIIDRSDTLTFKQLVKKIKLI